MASSGDGIDAEMVKQVPTENSAFKEPTPKDDTQEEAKLKAKYPNLRLATGRSALLQRQFQRDRKYFDSGDYQMAKQAPKGPTSGTVCSTNPPTGNTIPTPDSLPVRPIIPERSSQ